MNSITSLPRLLSAEQLLPYLGNADLVVVDLCKLETYQQGHIAGAIHLPYESLVTTLAGASGLVPELEALAASLSVLALDSSKRVVAYDEHNGAQAARLLWTLAYLGFEHGSLLDGGRPFWLAQGLPLTTEVTAVSAKQWPLCVRPELNYSAEQLLACLSDDQVQIWDARSAAEYRGEKVLAERGGHIPGALHLDWLDLIAADGRLKPLDLLQSLLEQTGFRPEKTIVCHCHTHRRSALAWWVLLMLGYPKIAAYDGSWSQWGNRNDLPVAL